MKIIITGATGSLGAYLTRWFAQKDHEIIATGRMKIPPENLLKYATYLQADITKPFSLPQADICIHTAAIADDKAGRKELFNTNITGTKNVVNAARSCPIFIHISSSSVYEHSNELLTEEMAEQSKLGNLSAYGASKLLAETALIKTSKNESCFILRPRGIYGPGDKVLLPRLLKLVQNERLIRAGTMQVNLSMTHFENFSIAIEKCILNQKSGIEIYNVADDPIYILYEVVRKLISEIYSMDIPEKKVPLWILKIMSAFHFGDITPLFIDTVSKSLALDISKIKNELNYSPLINLDNSLKDIHEWIKKIGGIAVLKNGSKEIAWL